MSLYPSRPLDDSRDGAARDAVLSRGLRERAMFRGVERADALNIYGRELCQLVRFVAQSVRAFLCIHIVDVILRSASEQVCRVHTAWIVATMQHIQSWWYWTVRQFVDNATGGALTIPYTDLSVAVRIDGTSPQPTLIRSGALRFGGYSFSKSATIADTKRAGVRPDHAANSPSRGTTTGMKALFRMFRCQREWDAASFAVLHWATQAFRSFKIAARTLTPRGWSNATFLEVQIVETTQPGDQWKTFAPTGKLRAWMFGVRVPVVVVFQVNRLLAWWHCDVLGKA